MKKYIAYYRISTKQQEKSGFGLEAQKDIVKRHINGATLAGEFTEIESGRKNSRPQLDHALTLAKERGAILIVAKVDRLTRDTRFLLMLLDSGVDIYACDVPAMDRFTLTVLAAVAEKECASIRGRIKSALAAKKDRGEKLGRSENFSQEGRKKGVESRLEKRRNDERNRRAHSYAKILREKGMSLRAIANELNETKFGTSFGGIWSAVTVANLLKLWK